MGRVAILLLDSFGVGAAFDASSYGDIGADTLGHIANRCYQGLADHVDVRSGLLKLPNLTKLGLPLAALSSRGEPLPGFDLIKPLGYYGYGVIKGFGKDTCGGHFELMGAPVLKPYGYFPVHVPCFPEQLVTKLCEKGKLPGILGNTHGSGTDMISQYGEEHIKTGKPIIYTSADSVFQIAAHEKHFGLDNLYKLGILVRELVDKYNINRVIARPFIGEFPNFVRTANRKDWVSPSPINTLLDRASLAGCSVIGIGKVSDIFGNRGITKKIEVSGNRDLFNKTLFALKNAPPQSIIFTNFIDFDTKYGHRRDVIGYAKALEDFDSWLPELYNYLKEDDICIITADHGCDPMFKGTDHTREHVPILVYGRKISSKFIGRRETLADVGQSIASFLKLDPLDYGISFFD